jgi:phosphate transport system permease protein
MHVIGTNDPLPEDEQMLAYTLLDDAEAGRINRRNWYYFRLPLGRGVLAGGLTLMLVILPVVIISSQEALRAVPSTLRDGARGLGATPWQVIWNVTLPASIPGMMTGIILAMSRAIGEAAPILIIAGIVYINRAPQHLMDDFSVMPMQIFNWTARPQEEFHGLAAAAIVVLMAILMVFNGLAIWIRLKFQKPLG